MTLRIAFLLLCSLIAGCDRGRGLVSTSVGSEYVRDSAAVLAPAEREMIEKQLALLERETGVDLRFVTVELGSNTSRHDSTLDDSVRPTQTTAPQSDAEFPIGSLGNREAPAAGTLVLVYHAQQGRLRMEVGYALEQIFPDAFMGFLIREHARYLFDDGRPGEALLFSVRVLRDHLRSAVLRGDLPAPSRSALFGHAHGGAGASEHAPLGARALDPFEHSNRADSLIGSGPLYGRAGDSVENAYRNYVAWLAAGRFETDLALFTAETRSFLADWPMTPGYLEHVLTKELGKSFEAVTREDRALYVCIDDPYVAPHFFVLGSEGWQIDLAAEAREVININGGRFSWSLRDPLSSDWLEPFSDQIVWVSGDRVSNDDASLERGAARRLRGGDNRSTTLPASSDREIGLWPRTDSQT